MSGAPPRIESFFLPGPAGRIECLLKHPGDPARAGAAAVVCHPHPLFGGTMHNKVVHAAAEAMIGAGLPVLRFNFRGAGGSTGAHDGGSGEQDDLRAALDHLAGRWPGRPILIAGYSFGAWVGLRVGSTDPRAAALIGIAPPVAVYDFGFLRDAHRPITLIAGNVDPFAPLDLVMRLGAALAGGARVLAVPGAAHGFADHLDDLARRVREAIPADLD
jgi:uncharacterized protein